VGGGGKEGKNAFDAGSLGASRGRRKGEELVKGVIGIVCWGRLRERAKRYIRELFGGKGRFRKNQTKREGGFGRELGGARRFLRVWKRARGRGGEEGKGKGV